MVDRQELGLWPRAEQLHRVFHVRSGAQRGTAFALDIDGRQYLVSALHVIEQALEVASLDVYGNGAWTALAVSVVGMDFANDIAVVSAQERLVPTGLDIIVNSTERWATGQQAFFLGFPLGIQGYLAAPGYPIPVAMRGIVSLFVPGEYQSVFISAKVSPGFSGAPVYYCPQESDRAVLMAIVTGSVAYEAPVWPLNNEGNADRNGKKIGIVDVDSGICRCHYVKHAVTLINKKIGLVLT
jgi:hypothetical protein